MSNETFPTNSDRRSKFQNNSVMPAGLGKLPPQAPDAEEALLGSMMNYENAVFSLIDFVKEEYFYVDHHRKIYKAIISLYEKHSPIDEITVVTQLRKQGELEIIGGPYAIAKLSGGTSINWDFNSKIIYEKYIARESIRISTEIIQFAYDDTTDIFELVEKQQSEVLGLTLNKTAKQARNMNDLVRECREEYKIPVLNGITGISCGLDAVDKLTHGFQKSNLIIIGARPSMGKTALMLECAKHCAIDLEKPVVIFSLEMSDMELTNRLISSETDTHVEKLITHQLDESDFKRIELRVEKLANAPIIIDDTPGISIFEFRAKCRRLKAQQDIQLIIVDYLQLMTGKPGHREQEISSISRALKSVAKELNVPVIALSQLSRSLENRPSGMKRPMLSDLRESGSIEQDADLVIFLYRDEYYGIYKDAAGQSTVGRCEVIIAKNRNGKTGSAVVSFNGAKMRFNNWDESNPNGLTNQIPLANLIEQSSMEFNANNDDDDDDLPF